MTTPVKQTFADLGLSSTTIDAINRKGFEEPTAIQAMTIPVMLKNTTNIIAQAQTGTGKTAAFGLPLIDLIDARNKSVQALILVPTRELAIQVAEEINSLKGSKDIRVIPIYGGQAIDQQLRRLREGVQIVVGSPGRVLDHLERKTLKLQEIGHLILDEADEMLNMGFIDDIEAIMKHTNPDKRTLLFSATMPLRIRELAKTYMDGYELLTIKKEQLTTSLTDQIYFEVRASDKFEALCRIIDIEDDFYGLVFCRTKSDVDEVTGHLIDRGYDAEAIHGDITQVQRERTLEKFKKRRITILVATDVAARGIDVSNLSHVINFALPQDPEAYVHRIGRTGRAGKMGTAITFITPSEYSKLMFIQRSARADIRKSKIPRISDIITAKKRKLSDDICALSKETIAPDFTEWAQQLLSDNDPAAMVAALLSYSFQEDLNPQTYGKMEDISPVSRSVDQAGRARLFVSRGRQDGLTAQKLIKAILEKVNLPPTQIADVQVMDTFSFVTVPFTKAEEIIAGFKERGQKGIVTLARKPRESSQPIIRKGPRS